MYEYFIHSYLSKEGRYGQSHIVSVKTNNMATYLIGPRKDRDGPVPQVPRVVDLLVPHFHLGVFQPQRDVSVVG